MFPGNLATLRFPVTGRIGPVTKVTVSIWYSLDSFNSSLKALGVIVMNRKPFRKKDIIKNKDRLGCGN